MPFSTGHKPPREGDEVALDEVEVGVVMFEDPVAMADEDAESPVVTPEENPEIDKVEFAGAIDVADGELNIDGAVLIGALGEINGGVVKEDGAELDGPPGVPVELIETAAEPEETVIIEVVGEPETVLRNVDKVVFVLLGDN